MIFHNTLILSSSKAPLPTRERLKPLIIRFEGPQLVVRLPRPIVKETLCEVALYKPINTSC